MSELIHLGQELQLKQELEKQRDVNRVLKEKLEYFTDRYGLPDGWDTEIIAREFTPAQQISSETAAVQEEKLKKLQKQILELKALRDLLIIQFNEVLEILANQNRQIISNYQNVSSLKEQLKKTINTIKG